MNQSNIWRTSVVLAGILTLCLPALAGTPAAQRSAAAIDLAKKQSNKYPTVDMRKGKRGEEKSDGVIYLNASQREERRVLIRQGLVYDHTGKLLPDTRSKHRNQHNYVMDAAGNFYLFDEFTNPSIRHSSIFAGGPVAGAGNIQVKAGRIVYLDSDSGHYPAEKVFANVLKELAACGVDTAAFSK